VGAFPSALVTKALEDEDEKSSYQAVSTCGYVQDVIKWHLSVEVEKEQGWKIAGVSLGKEEQQVLD
jgi:hypothetical protein